MSTGFQLNKTNKLKFNFLFIYDYKTLSPGYGKEKKLRESCTVKKAKIKEF